MANLVASLGLGNHDGVRTSRPVTRRLSAPEVDSPVNVSFLRSLNVTIRF
uniref:Uncharacterized protein n=1 Tax=Aegilops tauschii TaxID=37682 RepID=N1R2E0_AEGTA